jgi:hypothetical protein
MAAMGAREWSSAVAAFQWIVERDPRHRDAQMGLIAARQGQEATAALEKARDYLGEGRAAEAVATLEVLARMGPKWPEIDDLLAEARARQAGPPELPPPARPTPPRDIVRAEEPPTLSTNNTPPPPPPDNRLDTIRPGLKWPRGRAEDQAGGMPWWLVLALVLGGLWLVAGLVQAFWVAFGFTGIMVVVGIVALIWWNASQRSTDGKR